MAELKQPSEKQIAAAKIISKKLGIFPPEEFTSKAYWEFISEHMEESKSKAWRRSSKDYNDYRDSLSSRLKAQREADWQATHLNPFVWAQGVLDGKYMAPSWANETTSKTQARLRSLGFKSSLEEENERLKEEMWEARYRGGGY